MAAFTDTSSSFDLPSMYDMGGVDYSGVAGGDASGFNSDNLDVQQYLKGLKANGSSQAEQPNANWRTLDPNADSSQYNNYYADLKNQFNGVLDWSKLGYNGPSTSAIAEGNLGASGDGQGNGSGSTAPNADQGFIDFINKNGYGELGGKNEQGFNLRQLTQNGKAIQNASVSYSDPDPAFYSIIKGVTDAGLLAGGAMAASGQGAGQAAAEGTTGFSGNAAGAVGSGSGNTLGSDLGSYLGSQGGTAGSMSSSDLAALYGNTGYGSTGGMSWEGLGSAAGKGALTNGGLTAVKGGSGSDILKGAAIGAVAGGVGYGVGGVNPGSYVTDNAAGQSIINRGVSGGVNAGLSGGNVGTGALWSAGTQAGNVGGEAASDYFKNSGGSQMPDMFAGDYQNDIIGSQPYGGSPFYQGNPQVDQEGGLSNNYAAGATSDVSQPQQQNPYKSMISKALGLAGGGGEGGGGGFKGAGDMAGSLLGMYSAYQQKKKLGGLADNLSSLYGPNSAYAGQLRQQLDRRDAAAGRRSQYGPREAELQARLADSNARMAPTLQSIYGAQQNQNNALLNNGLRLGQQTGLGSMAGNYIQNQGMPWLNSLFNATPANSGPQLYD